MISHDKRGHTNILTTIQSSIIYPNKENNIIKRIKKIPSMFNILSFSHQFFSNDKKSLKIPKG